MASKRDQLQAHQFMLQRVISAIVTRETDPETPPFRRPSIAAAGGVVLAAVAIGATWIFGMLVPGGNDAWRDGDSVIVDSDAGTRFVYLQGKLHPVANVASAKLALGNNAETMTVSANSLAGVPRGVRIGIPGAPDELPDAEHVLSGGWTLCSQPGTDVAGEDVDHTVLLVGRAPGGGQDLDDRALLLTDADNGDEYLIWRGYKHLISHDAVVDGLTVGMLPKHRVGTELLNALPEGEALKPIKVSGIGKKSKAVPGRDDVRVGQVLHADTEGGGTQHYLAETKRLRPISALQADIQLAYGPTIKAYGNAEPIGVPVGTLPAAAKASLPPEPSDRAAPAQRPEFVDAGRGIPAVCATYGSNKYVPQIVVDPELPPAARMMPTEGTDAGGAPLADAVYVPPGHVAVVEVMISPAMMVEQPSSPTPAGTVLLVTEQGRAYPLTDPDDLDTLGYGGTSPVRLSANLIARIPQGPALSPEDALKPVESTPGT